ASIGLAALMAAMGSLGGFREGGYTGDGDPNEVAGLVHRGEMVFDQAAVQGIGRDRLEGMRMNRAMPGGLASGGVGRAGNTTFSPNLDVAPPQVHVAVLDRPEKIAAFMKSLPGQAIILDAIKGNKMELGIGT
ncbi:MAG: Lambda phage tail tape-measure protein, partial [Verrucomicrobia bacterium]|nr:Lambda phage tail tape-measure protein [Verrucomicrobiota bacterium]